ncbi:MAG: hypothetical protein CMC91_04665 [Flavobacteriaceae bacterium]|nr:hypothetical protein [Flavobacteriaceae bacterium]MBR99033.1 hypothetical protein [Flavobacteriaceae bacterium]
MLKNLSYNCKKTKDLLIDRVGKPLTLFERLKIGGNGSDKLIITDASNDIVELLKLDNNINQCNIEIRSNGIIVRFRALLETYGLVIPFYKMVIYKGEKKIYSIYIDNQYIKFLADKKSIHSFIKKINRLKSEYLNKTGFY